MNHQNNIKSSIQQQLHLNRQCFKKNKQNIQRLSNQQHLHTITTIKSQSDLKQIKQILKDNLKSLSTHKSTSTQAYQCVIKQLKLLLKQAWTKNQFLHKDRAQVLVENKRLNRQMQVLRQQVQQGKRVICEMRLNGNSSGDSNGVYENGNIFNTLLLQSQRQSQQDDQSHNNVEYKRQQQRQMNYKMIHNLNNNNNINNNNINNSNKQRSYSQSQQQQSMLLRQGSQQGLQNNNNNNNKNNNNLNILSPNNSQHQQQQQQYLNISKSPSQINLTPNYNYKESNFGIQYHINNNNNNNIQQPGHFIDIGSQFISYANSHNNSGSINLINKHQNSQQLLSNSGQRQQHNNNELYLPINQNKIILKQQIQTFKQHLRIVNSNNNSNKNSQQNQRDQSNDNHNNMTPISPYIQQHTNNYNNNNTTTINKPYGLRTQQLIVACSSTCQQGIFRSFYLSLLTQPIYRQKILCLLQQLQHDQSFIIYKPYPKNSFWVGLVNSFLTMINMTKQTPEQILEHLNRHKLIDTLMIQVLKARVEYLYNDFTEDVDQDQQSELLNGSISNVDNNNNFNINRNSNKNSNNIQSANISLQNITQFQSQPQLLSPSSQQQQPTNTATQSYLQIFNALANSFDISCQSNGRFFQFYSSQQQEQFLKDSNNNNQISPIFIIQNDEQRKSFILSFGLYYQKSQQHTQQKHYITNTNNHNDNDYDDQIEEYQNSVKRQFQDINLNLNMNVPLSTQRRRQMMDQSSNLLNSGQQFYIETNNKNNNNNNNRNNKNRYDKNSNNKNSNNNKSNNNKINNNKSNNKHYNNNTNNKQQQQLQGSFISQTNCYEDSYQQESYNQNNNNNDYIDTSNQFYPQREQIISENITYNNTLDNTLNFASLRTSEQYQEDSLLNSINNQIQQQQQKQSHQLNNHITYRTQQQQPRQLRQRRHNQYNNTMYQPIQQQVSIQRKSKLTTYSSYNKPLLKLQSYKGQSSTNPSSQVVSRVNNNNNNNRIRNKENNLCKQRQRYQGDIYEQNFILRKVKSVESDNDDNDDYPINQGINTYKNMQ